MAGFANRQVQTAYEELQSTVEELETMNEELRSTNDEIQAINVVLRRRTDEHLLNLDIGLPTDLTKPPCPRSTAGAAPSKSESCPGPSEPTPTAQRERSW